MLNFSKNFSICCLLDSNNYKDAYSEYDFLFAADAIKIFSAEENILQQLSSFLLQHDDWLFGHISYELKNEIESLASLKKNQIQFPLIFFFQPDIIIECKDGKIVISSISKKPAEIFESICNCKYTYATDSNLEISVQARISRKEYLEIIEKLQQYILRGDCYEINFCQEFFSENVLIDPEYAYQKLSSISPSPFAAFYRLNDKYLMCASPERFIKKHGHKIISQPIKGTIERKIGDDKNDFLLKEQLRSSVKDKSENVMIVDLVRNDFSKICKENSVEVEELFGVYSFSQVHQMISTISGELHADTGFEKILQATFPMGSMTGAPKKSVMQIIDKFEENARGIFSGSVGYISPEKNFDFNVVIRSLMFNAANNYLSYEVGGGITFYSNAEQEYNECLLKAEAMKRTLA